MASADGLKFKLKSNELNGAIAKFLRNKAPDIVDQAVRKIAADIVAETVKGITTISPTRVDTGRYRAGWGIAANKAGLDVSVPSARGSQGADGSGGTTGRGLFRVVTVSNNVEYAIHVEVGTRYMAAGNHLTRALIKVRRAVPDDKSKGSINDEIRSAWYR